MAKFWGVINTLRLGGGAALAFARAAGHLVLFG